MRIPRRLYRTLFCPKCKTRGGPEGSETVISLKDGVFSIYEKPEIVNKELIGSGYTPHLIENIKKTDEGSFIADVRCMVHGCGIDAQEKILATDGNYDYVELLFKDNIINFQSTLLHLSNLLDRFSMFDIDDIPKEAISPIQELMSLKDDINQIFLEHRTILDEYFSPGKYNVRYLNVRHETFEKNTFQKLIEADEKIFPKIYIFQT